MKHKHLAAIALLLPLAIVSCQKDTTTSGPRNTTSGDSPAATQSAFDNDGMSKYSFSVSSFKRVGFSRGNLQYQASTNTWRFAEHQYDYIGADNTLISSVNSGWIDLFGWGTSGWNSGAVAYQPYSVSNNNADYYPGGSSLNDLVDNCANADWGIYIPVSNGGNTPGLWHTLNSNEWRYLLGQSGAENRVGKWGLAVLVDLYKGLVILPDSWSLPDGLSFTPGATSWDQANKYSDAQWEQMEAAGAIFLPAAGCRYANGIDLIGDAGIYWSTTHYNESRAYNIYFSDATLDMVNRNYRSNGLSVRLVKKK